MKHKKEIYEAMKRRDFGESMSDETKLEVLNFVERQLRLRSKSMCSVCGHPPCERIKLEGGREQCMNRGVYVEYIE